MFNICRHVQSKSGETTLGLVAEEVGNRRIGGSEGFGGRRGRNDGVRLHVVALPFPAITTTLLSLSLSLVLLITVALETK
jgi:hypothetical protein